MARKMWLHTVSTVEGEGERRKSGKDRCLRRKKLANHRFLHGPQHSMSHMLICLANLLPRQIFFLDSKIYRMRLAYIKHTAVLSPHKQLYLDRLAINRKTASLIIYPKTKTAAFWKVRRNSWVLFCFLFVFFCCCFVVLLNFWRSGQSNSTKNGLDLYPQENNSQIYYSDSYSDFSPLPKSIDTIYLNKIFM